MNLKDFEMMKSERWRQIRQIFDDAAKLAPANRAAFLRENCQADEDLRREIESLLSSYDDAESFMEQPAVGKVAGMIMSKPDKLKNSQRVSHYEIVKQIGAGGMGETFFEVKGKEF